MGRSSGIRNTTGNFNSFMGIETGFYNDVGDSNLSIGCQAGFYNSAGSGNICLGFQSGYYNQNNLNTFIGYLSGYKNLNGTNNTFIGFKTGYNNYSNVNTYFGNLVGQLNDGNNNFFLGYETVGDVTNLSAITHYNNKFAIYNNTQSGITSNTSSNCTILIGGDFSTGTVGIGTLVPDQWILPSLTSFTSTSQLGKLTL